MACLFPSKINLFAIQAGVAKRQRIQKKISKEFFKMINNFLNNYYKSLPDKNSLGATFTFEVETFHSVKLFNLTTKLVVKHFRN